MAARRKLIMFMTIALCLVFLWMPRFGLTRRGAQRTTAAAAAAATAPAWAREVVHTAPFHLLHHPGGYPQFLFVDLFLSRGELCLISRHYRSSPVDFASITVGVQGRGGKLVASELTFDEWHSFELYESSMLGVMRRPEFHNVASLNVSVTYGDQTKQLVVSQTPEGRPTRFAMCTIFHTDRHLLPMWATYWAAMGVGSFYMYYNGPEEDIPMLQDMVYGLPANVVIIHWPYLYWIPEQSDPHHGQPMGINNCYYRWRHLHELMFFFDLDELIVLPQHNDLNHFLDDWPEPFTSIRSQMAWTKLQLDTLQIKAEDVRLKHLAMAPVIRGPVRGDREKYCINTTAGVHTLNVHGVYTKGTVPIGYMEQIMAPHDKMYHVHFVNVGRDRERENLLPPPAERVVDDKIQLFVTEAARDKSKQILFQVGTAEERDGDSVAAPNGGSK